MKVGILGFGRLGALLTRHFARDWDIRVYDLKPRPREIRRLGAKAAALAEACRQEVVIPCVPIRAFEDAVARMRPHLRENALVVDVCSVMEYPVDVMRRLLPGSVQLLATHPNFGPDSAAESLRGRKIAVCKVRVDPPTYGKFRRALEKKGLRIVEMSPAEHDRESAASLVLTHVIGRALIALGARATEIDTEGYRRLLAILQTVENDSWALFEDMNRYNAYAAPMRRKLLSALRALDRRVSR